ncbi:MAG: response regulator [Verrucomicrobia bacterium]|nr:response regulator [Verrucomicrobiota bacterium]
MKRTILAVDDEQALLALLEASLVTSDFNVHKAANGKDALKLARKLQPDLILLDILMPGMNGYEVLEQLKNDDNTAMIPVIMLSGLSDEEAKIKSAELYSESYLTKPFTTGELLAKIEEVFRRRGN